MKKLDSLLIKAFLPPFTLMFGIVMFVFTMQTMWKFIDDIIGKGAGLAMIFEFVFYLSLGLIPLSLPAAILLASIMVMGTLAERYELTSMKSAGISLWRIMWPLIGIGLLISIFSFVCNNNMVPVANLKFKTRLYNFKTKKLALSLEEDVFNDDFRNFSIRIDKKHESGDLEKIMLYDHSAEHRNRTKIILAEKGRMDMESDERYLIMHLEEGQQYQELEEEKGWKKGDPRKYPYLRTNFRELEKYMDLKEFDMKDVNEEIFKDEELMLSIRQILWQLDTMEQQIDKRRKDMSKSAMNSLFFVKTSDTTSLFVPLAEAGKSSNNNTKKNNEKSIPNPGKRNIPKTIQRPGINKKNTPPPKKKKDGEKTLKLLPEQLNGTPASLEEVFSFNHRKQVITRATSNVKTLESRIKDFNVREYNVVLKQNRYLYQVHLKIALAAACMVFLFIGASLGAIVRKGGFGVPILFGTLLFVTFVAMVTVFKKMADAGNISSGMAAWGPIIIFAIPCILLTRGAVRDAKAMNLDLLSQTITNFFMGNRKKK